LGLAGLSGVRLSSALSAALLVAGAGVGAGLLFGDAGSLRVFGWSPLPAIATAWRALWGWGAWPAAAALVVAGGAVFARRQTDPLTWVWTRALGAELFLFAALALSAAAWGPRSPAEEGPGGLIGWALLAASRLMLGRVATTLLWSIVGLVGILAAFQIGARRIARGLEIFAEAVQPPTATAPVSRATPPRPPAPVVPEPPETAQPPSASRKPSGRPKHSPGPVAAPVRAGSPEPEPPGPAPRPATPEPGGRTVRAKTRTPAGEPAAPPSRPAALPPRRGAARDLPGLDLLPAGAGQAGESDDAGLQAMAETIVRTLGGFGVPVEVVTIERGPAFTRFGLRPGQIMRAGQPTRVRVARITALRQDLAMALAVPAIRMEAPVPGKSLVGIEVPNPHTDRVALRDLLASAAFTRARRKSPLVLALGQDVSGAPAMADLGAMPHLLIAGTTGSGKSVCLGVILASLLFQNTPDALRLVLVDPKRVEMARYNRLPHLVAPVVTDVPEAIGALRWVVAEMDQRYQRFAARGARDRATFNARSPAGEAPIGTLVVVIDELADLMMASAADTEPLLTRVAQLGRTAGIHLIVATQRPSTDVITGLIKANFPARIAFAVTSGVDSRVILDQVGAETLLGRGDMLFQAPDAPHPRRVQGALVADGEIDALVAFWCRSHWSEPPRLPPWDDLVPSDDPDAELYAKAQAIAAAETRVSPSLLQRRLRIGFGKARQMYDRLDADGWLGQAGEGASHEDASPEDEGDDPGPRRGARSGRRPGGSRIDWVDDEFEG